MIIESIVTTLDEEGRVNIAPMGVEWGEETILIKPYKETATFRNLTATGTGVINLTDNVLIFAESAIANPVLDTRPAVALHGMVLQDVCSWREVEVLEANLEQPRAHFTTRVVYRGFNREFLGFNRARHAVLEAAILATRTRFLPAAEILADFERLQVIVDKTAGPQEHQAMSMLTKYVQKELAS